MPQGNDVVLYLATISVTLTSVMNSLFVAWTSPMLPLLTAADSPIPLTQGQSTWIASILHAGLLIMAIPAGLLAMRFGRKPLLLCSAAPALLALQMASAATSFEVLVVSRVLAGMHLGISLLGMPMYLTEITRDSNRGLVGTGVHVFSTVGSLLAYSVGPYVQYREFQLFCSIFPILFIITFVWMPESPYFLLSKGLRDEAAVSLATLRGEKCLLNVQEELDKIQLNLDKNANQRGTIKDLLFSKGNQKALIITLVLSGLILLSGYTVVMSYAGVIFRKSGSSIDANMSAIYLGIVQTVACIASSFFVDKVGRRPLLMISYIGSSVTIALEGLYFFLQSEDFMDMSALDWMPLTFMILFVTMYAIGIGPVSMLVISELFPPNVKGLGLSIGAINAGICALVVTELYMVVAQELDLYVSFWGSAIFCLLGAVFVAVYVPETKGKTLLEITQNLSEVSEFQQIEKAVSDNLYLEKHPSSSIL